MSVRAAVALLFAIVLAAWLRLPGVTFGLPLFVHPDEAYIVEPSVRMAGTGDLNPKRFQYPSLVMYLNGALYASGARLTGAGDVAAVDPVRMRRWARTMTVVFAVATVPVVYAAAALAFGQTAGIAAAFLLAASRLHVANSFAVTTDAPVTFAAALALWTALAIVVRGPTLSRHLLAGAAVGLTAGTKYPGVFVAASVVAAHLATCGPGPRALWKSGALAGAAMAAAVFLMTTPYAALDFEEFRSTLSWQSEHFSNAHPGAEAKGATSYGLYLGWASEMLGDAGGLLVLVGLATALAVRPRAAFVLCAFPAVYLLVMGSHRVAFERYLVVLLPAVVITAVASFALAQNFTRRAAVGVVAALALIWGVAVTGEVRDARAHVAARTRPDTRMLADTWIRENLPAGARIARENYTPTLIGAGFRVDELGYFGLIRATGLGRYHFLISSSSDYGRFVNHPDRYPQEATAYGQLFARYREVRRIERGFVHAGPTIHILATDKGSRLLQAGGSAAAHDGERKRRHRGAR